MKAIEKLLNYDALQEMYCVVWYSKFKRFPAPSRVKVDRKILERRIELLRKHRPNHFLFVGDINDYNF